MTHVIGRGVAHGQRHQLGADRSTPPPASSAARSSRPTVGSWASSASSLPRSSSRPRAARSRCGSTACTWASTTRRRVFGATVGPAIPTQYLRDPEQRRGQLQDHHPVPADSVRGQRSRGRDDRVDQRLLRGADRSIRPPAARFEGSPPFKLQGQGTVRRPPGPSTRRLGRGMPVQRLRRRRRLLPQRVALVRRAFAGHERDQGRPERRQLLPALQHRRQQRDAARSGRV